MTKLLLVEDDVSLGATLQERLSKEGYQVAWAKNQEEALHKFASGVPDLLVLDVGLPDGSGFELAKVIRKQSTIPFIFVTAMTTAEYRLKGFELGAEEYIPKPFHLKEILLRVKHVLQNHSVKKTIDCGDRVLDLSQMSIQSQNGDVERLALRDFQLLKLLIDRSPAVVSRAEILNEIWGEDKFPTNRTIDNAIVRLRQALGEGGTKFIRSIRGVGYSWEAVNNVQ